MTEWLDVGIRQQGTGGKTVKRDLDEISKSSEEADKNLAKLGKQATIVGGIIGSVVAGAATMVFMGFKNATQSIKETLTYAKQLGEGVETFSQLDFAAKSFDVTTKTLADSMENLQRVQTQAAKPGSEMNKLFAQLDIEAVKADGSLRQTSEVLRDVADIFQRMPAGTDKATLAMKLFGNENRELIGLLNEGSQGLDEMANKSDELGYTVGENVAEDVKKFYDELDDVKLQLESLYRQALPGLLPYMQEFGRLLNSQEFKDGFNSIIQGAAQTIVWLAKMTTQFTNTITTLAENVAARQYGASLDDAPRVNEELDRIEARMKRLQEWQSKGRFGRAISGTGPTDPYAKGRDASIGVAFSNAEEGVLKELNILTERRTTLMQAQRDIASANWDAEQADIKKTMEALQKYDERMANGGKDPNAPTIDWTALGGGKGPKEKKDRTAERELRRLTSEYEQLMNVVDPVVSAQLKLDEAEKTLAGAVKQGWVEREKANEYLEQYEYLLRDQLDPMNRIREEMEKELKVAGMVGREREIEVQLMERLQYLRQNNITLTAAETEEMRKQLVELQKANELSSAKESILAGSSGRQMENFGIDLSAFEDIKSQLTEGDKFNWLNAALGGTLDETQSALDSRLEQLDIYYQMVQQFRDADVDNAKLAAEAMDAIERERMSIQIAQVSDGLGQIAQLMGSHNKKAFKIGQAAAIAQVAIKTPEAAMNAYNSLSGIPYVGPILGGIAAAAAVMLGMQQISKIRSQQPPQFRTGGSMIVGGSGGIDSQNIHLRATPGERININTPAQARAMEKLARDGASRDDSPNVVNSNVTIVQQGRANNRTSTQQAREVRKETRKVLE